MSIWQKDISIELLTAAHQNTATSNISLEFLEVGDEFIRGRVPVDDHTRQPYGLLHAGVRVVLAEPLGSCAAAYSCPVGHHVVGIDINANHLKGVRGGWIQVSHDRFIGAGILMFGRLTIQRCKDTYLRLLFQGLRIPSPVLGVLL